MTAFNCILQIHSQGNRKISRVAEGSPSWNAFQNENTPEKHLIFASTDPVISFQLVRKSESAPESWIQKKFRLSVLEKSGEMKSLDTELIYIQLGTKSTPLSFVP